MSMTCSKVIPSVLLPTFTCFSHMLGSQCAVEVNQRVGLFLFGFSWYCLSYNEASSTLFNNEFKVDKVLDQTPDRRFASIICLPKENCIGFPERKSCWTYFRGPKIWRHAGREQGFVGELSVTLVNALKLPYIFSVLVKLLKLFQVLVSNPREQVLQIEVNDCLGFADMAIGTGQVDLGSLPDTVPKDRVVVFRGGWSLFGKGSAGELLLRLTFKAYVEDEEDEKRNAKANVPYASDDEMSDSEEPSSFVKNDKIPSDDPSESSVSPVPSKAGEDSKSQPEDFGSGGISEFEVKNVNSDGGIALLWFGVITSVLVLVAINMAGSSFFNP
ncbi:hypothetical protein HID58_002989 [Brassica napus]|uniref:Uncharacterized protein n=1 Tax=Brassica napus TaxID=3708 RepID=A0ABQ8ENX4_BRANA|nr:hypothetical protein HID58_002989 [Brassica napus]